MTHLQISIDGVPFIDQEVSDEALVALSELASKLSSPATGARQTVVVDGVERYTDTGDAVDAVEVPPATDTGAAEGQAPAEQSAPPAEGDGGGAEPEPAPAADPANPTVSQVFDGAGNVVGTIDSTTGEFTPAPAA